MGAPDPCHIVDSRFHGGGYATGATRAIFGDRARLQRWLDVEVALARSQAELGIIPTAAAAEIERRAIVDRLDLRSVAGGIHRTGHSIVPLLGALRSACDGDAGEWIHFGATTQDIQDTAQSLEMGAVLDALVPQVDAVIRRLAQGCRLHRDQLMVARTHSVAALPTTFGLKMAGWLDELSRQRDRLVSARPRILVAQLFGGAGTMAALGSRAVELLERFSARLGLTAPSTAWHVARDRMAEYVHLLAMVSATAARIADEIRTLNRNEIGEVEIGWSAHQVGSSTMPHKRNPEACEQVVALARLTKAQVPLALDAMVLEHERDYRGTRLEWCAVADASHYSVAALTMLDDVIASLTVHGETMAGRAFDCREALCTEAFVFALAQCRGKETAYRLVREISQRSQDQGNSFSELLCHHPGVIEALGGPQAVERLLDPRNHLGAHGELIDRVLRSAESPPPLTVVDSPPVHDVRRAVGQD
ncbi:MAG: adenylosuccinate lyase family protein [Deltaproteobacteria bacterium]|nr:adenylosuccinate lyase family protein [Deltaproteobacteria bacterium]